MMMQSTEIVVLLFCVLAVLAAPAWVVMRFLRPPRRSR